MAGSMQDTLRELLISTVEGAGQSSKGVAEKASGEAGKHGSGVKGIVAGVGAAALAPVAFKGLSRLAREAGVGEIKNLVKSPGEALGGITGSIGSSLGDKVSDKVDEAGGPSGIVTDAVKGALPFGGGDDGGGKTDNQGVGKGRRMPVQQCVDIGVPLETVYNQWTQFEDWPNFMHRVTRVTQDDDCTVTFATKIWGKTKEFTAELETQRPDERIKWKVSKGMTHAGVVTFHELGPNLTRVMLSFDVAPGSLIEKLARGARHVKRAARADLHRFKAYIEMLETETGAWRGVIEDGEVVEEHDPSYDKGREYSDPDALQEGSDEEDSSGDNEDQEDDDQDEEPQAKRPRRRRQPSSNGHGSGQGSSGRSRSGSGSGSRSRSSSSRSSGGSSRGSGNGGSSSSRSSGSRSTGRTSGSSSSSRRTRSRGSNS
jgi:uncharacterized membrane protein